MRELQRDITDLRKMLKKDHSYFYCFQQAEDAKQNRQSSFRKACSCIDKMATLRKVTYQPIEWNTYFYVNFNALKEAFDDGDRNTIYRVAQSEHYSILAKCWLTISETCLLAISFPRPPKKKKLAKTIQYEINLCFHECLTDYFKL